MMEHVWTEGRLVILGHHITHPPQYWKHGYRVCVYAREWLVSCMPFAAFLSYMYVPPESTGFCPSFTVKHAEGIVVVLTSMHIVIWGSQVILTRMHSFIPRPSFFGLAHGGPVVQNVSCDVT